MLTFDGEDVLPRGVVWKAKPERIDRGLVAASLACRRVQQFPGLNLEGRCDSLHTRQARISFETFNGSDVGSMKS